MKHKWAIVQYALTAVFLAGGIYFLVQSFPLGRAFYLVRDSNPYYIVLALSVYYGSYAARSERWRNLLSVVSEESLDRVTVYQVTIVGYFMNVALPAKLGDIYRALLSSNVGLGTVTDNVSTIIAERGIDFAVLLALISCLLPIVVGDGRHSLYSLAALCAIGLIILTVMMINKNYIPEVARDQFVALRESLLDVFTLDTEKLILVCSWTLLISGLNVIRVFFVGISVGVSMTMPEAALLMAVIMVLSGIPYVQAGAGIVEVVGPSVLIAYGVSAEKAAAIIIIDRLITIISLIPVGALTYTYKSYTTEAWSIRLNSRDS